MEDDDQAIAAGQEPVSRGIDGSSPSPKISVDFCADHSAVESSNELERDGEALSLDVQVSRQLEAEDSIIVNLASLSPSVHDILDLDQPNDTCQTPKISSRAKPQSQRLEISIPAISSSFRDQYEEIHSEVVERVLARTISNDGEVLNVEFTDGTQHKIPLDALNRFENGQRALHSHLSEMEWQGTKRKHAPNDEWDSENSSQDFEAMDLDIDVNAVGSIASRRSQSLQQTIDDEVLLNPRRRSLRKRQPRLTQTTLQFEEPDERDGQRRGEEDEDDFFLPVMSDIAMVGPIRRGHLQRSRRLRAKEARFKLRKQSTARGNSGGSDIEFEPPRRSSRATRTVRYAQDDVDMDDDFTQQSEHTKAGTPRFTAVKEYFRLLPSESLFPAVHTKTCNTCGSSNSRSQIIYCQGCSYVYHRHCIGPRNARDHLVTKIGEENFVLQCRFCVEVHRKKDRLAPRRSMCQTCQASGLGCKPFSERKTTRQEEKLREENNGVDPVSAVSKELLNNSNHVLFRCLTCHRAWHQEHLPPIGSKSPTDDQSPGVLNDYSIDWQCNECTSSPQKIHRLVAWRVKGAASATTKSFEHFGDDEKEYLVKWEGKSYFYCTWMPGAWIFGIAAGVMKSAFAKRATETDLFKKDEQEAIPEEYMTVDIIFRAKWLHTAPRVNSLEDGLASISQISKVLVKFHGLGYDDVVWDKPPTKNYGDQYEAFEAAYEDYLAGKYFLHASQHSMRERIKSFKEDELEVVETQPAGLKRGKLMKYQLEGLNWLLGNYHQGRSVVLADEMGLGKTVQVVSFVTYMVQEKPGCWPFLISVPNATCQNWRREFKQWAPDLRVVTYHGGKESQDLAYTHELFPDESRDMAAHVVIMSYDSTQDPQTAQRFKAVRWVGLVVDEGQRLKNDQNLLYQALRTMKIPFRLLLTGTPLQNNKRELFNLIQFIDQSQNAEKLDQEFEVLDKETLPKLHEKIRPYFLRRTKAGVLKFLPPMAQIILPVTMTVIQEKLSKSIMAKNPQLIKAIFANDKMKAKERGSLNNILMQLRKCLCHPFMYSEAIEEKHDDPRMIHRNLVEASAKLLLLEVMLPKLKERGHRVLIFSQFLQQLDIVEDFLNGIGFLFKRLDGQLSSLEKQRRIDAFNAPDSPIFAFLLSTRSGGVGINLATADTVIIMDPDFNPHQDIQALSRAHRIGQKNKVLCFQLMTKDTAEERIMLIGKKKMALDHALIESMDDEEVAGDDLESILKYGAQALFSDDYQNKSINYDGPAVDRLLDRSQIEQTKFDDEGSAETQFSYAKVWSNEKSSLEDGLALEAEAEAPVPLSSSVWDRILKEREEEARRQAEANKEVLGRGGRRRKTTNYKSDSLSQFLKVGDEEQHSDSSDDFAGGAESSTESETDFRTEGKARKASHARSKTRSTSATPIKQTKGARNVDKDKQQTMTPTTSPRRTPPTPKRTKQQHPTAIAAVPTKMLRAKERYKTAVKTRGVDPRKRTARRNVTLESNSAASNRNIEPRPPKHEPTKTKLLPTPAPSPPAGLVKEE